MPIQSAHTDSQLFQYDTMTRLLDYATDQVTAGGLNKNKKPDKNEMKHS